MNAGQCKNSAIYINMSIQSNFVGSYCTRIIGQTASAGGHILEGENRILYVAT